MNLQNAQVIRAAKSDSRLANNNLPPDIQKLRCRACYEALRFAPGIEAMGKVKFKLRCWIKFYWLSLHFLCNTVFCLICFVVTGGSNESLWPLHCFTFTI